jgi:serine/threonine-protein kinase
VLRFAAPVRAAGGEIVAALAVAVRADGRFARLLAPGGDGDGGAAGDAYAFDGEGTLLTEARYREALRTAGALASGGGFGVRLRDPGRDLVAAPGAVADLAQRPLTRLAAEALAARGAADPGARAGVLLTPYPNYAGRPVVGAWRWLPEHRLGVAVELASTEAYAPLRHFAVAIQVIFGALALALAVALGAAVVLAALRREERRLGPYRLESVIEEGGMATVHRAEHALLKRPTAVKILKPHLASDELIARFEREVTLASRLQHPATVEIFDFGRTRDGTFYYAMEFIDGVNLAQLVERDGAQPVARVAYVLRQVCESLREAHAKGLVHRDVKPQNIMLCERGGESDVVKVLDWGLIKDVRATGTRDITQYARVLGTPAYMAPERVRDPAQADPLVDIWGLGAVAFLLLTGRRLFDAPNDFELQRLILEVDAPRVSAQASQAIPASLDALVERCLAKDPTQRVQRVDDLLEGFDALLREWPWTQEEARRWWRDWPAPR